MRANLAASILAMLGPGRVLHAGTQDAGCLSELLLAGCDAWASGEAAPAHPRWLTPDQPIPGAARLDTLLLEIGPGRDFVPALRHALQTYGLPRALAIRAPGLDRRGTDAILFAAGWRRHPGALTAAAYPELREDVLGELAFYQPLPAEAAARWPVAALLRGSPLPADRLRETGGQADAELARYALAAQLVRPGDRVLDCACGAGHGTAVLAALSRGGCFEGIDPDPGAVDYARTSYGGQALHFTVGDAAALRDVKDASVDFLVSMAALGPTNWQEALAEFRRVLRPDGRLVLGLPADAGAVPLWSVLRAELARLFIVEAHYAQSPAGEPGWPETARALHPVPLNVQVERGWLLTVASVDPLAEGLERRVAFRHPAFENAYEATGAALVAFRRDYDNPYLYRAMVQPGERLMDDGQLIGLAGRAAATVRPGSADQGAALCVLGYRALESRNPAAAAATLGSIAAYLNNAGTTNAHVMRWRISLAFLAGRLAALRGEQAAAIGWFRLAAGPAWREFSPLLATKAVAASFYEGMLHLTTGDPSAARDCFARGVADALDAARGEARDILGDPADPIPFGLTELAEVVDMGSQCANALAALPLIERDPGLFWRQVDVRRFGMMSWTRGVTQANAALMQRNQQLETELRQLTDQLRTVQAPRPAALANAPAGR